MDDIGTQIIEEIVKQGMFRVSHPDPDEAHVFVWSSGAAEQLHALVCDSIDVQMPRREADLYRNVLKLLGAPDANSPADLIEWATKTGERLRV